MSEGSLTANTFLIDAIKEKVKKTFVEMIFVEMIPQEEFDKMVKVALDEFINGPSEEYTGIFDRILEDGGYFEKRALRNSPVKRNMSYIVSEDPLTLPGMIRKALMEHTKQQVQKLLQSEEFTGILDYSSFSPMRKVADGAIKDWLDKNAPELVQKMIASIIASQMQASAYNNQIRY